MKTRPHAFLLLVVAVLLGPWIVIANGDHNSSDESPQENIPGLIRELEANRFSQRQAASHKLRQLGKAAMPALIEAALSDSRETATRSFQILKDHFTQGKDETKLAAKAALKKLADSDNPSVARKAKDLLDPKPQPQARPVFRMAPGNIQFNIQVGGARQIQVQTINGVKTVTVKENDRTIKIHEDPKKGITVEITEKKDGKEVTKKSAAKDVAELKKKHPEAHKVYEQYKNGGGMQWQLFGAQGGQIVPRAANRPAPKQLLSRHDIVQQLKQVTDQLDATRKLLDKLKSKTQDTESLQKAIDGLEQSRKDLENIRSKTQ